MLRRGAIAFCGSRIRTLQSLTLPTVSSQ